MRVCVRACVSASVRACEHMLIELRLLHHEQRPHTRRLDQPGAVICPFNPVAASAANTLQSTLSCLAKVARFRALALAHGGVLGTDDVQPCGAMKA